MLKTKVTKPKKIHLLHHFYIFCITSKEEKKKKSFTSYLLKLTAKIKKLRDGQLKALIFQLIFFVSQDYLKKKKEKGKKMLRFTFIAINGTFNFETSDDFILIPSFKNTLVKKKKKKPSIQYQQVYQHP